MLDISERVPILHDLIHNGCLQQARILSDDELKSIANRRVVAGVKGKIKIEDQEISLWVGIRESFPLTLPIIFLQPADALKTIPHLEEDGYLCYLDSEGLLLDIDRPLNILIEAINRATDLLEASINSENRWGRC